MNWIELNKNSITWFGVLGQPYNSKRQRKINEQKKSSIIKIYQQIPWTFITMHFLCVALTSKHDSFHILHFYLLCRTKYKDRKNKSKANAEHWKCSVSRDREKCIYFFILFSHFIAYSLVIAVENGIAFKVDRERQKLRSYKIIFGYVIRFVWLRCVHFQRIWITMIELNVSLLLCV